MIVLSRLRPARRSVTDRGGERVCRSKLERDCISRPGWRGPVPLRSLAVLCVVLGVIAPPAAAAMRVATGTFVGDGQLLRPITGVGFRPDVALVKGDTKQFTVVRTATMPPSTSKILGKSDPVGTGGIVSLDSNGFTIGPNATVNSPGVTYYWVAFQASPGEMALGTYPGNDVDNRSITGVGFQPAYVIVFNEDNEDAMQRYAAEVGDESLPFQASDPKSDRIQALEPDGFQIGKHHTVNEASRIFHYIAWADEPGRSFAGAYAGDGSDGRAITGAGFIPDYLLLTRRENGSDTVQRSASMTGDNTLPVTDDVAFPDAIQALLSDGLEVGTHRSVNEAEKTYYWVAFHDQSSIDLDVGMGVDRPRPDEGDTLTYSVEVLNHGPEDATGVVLSERLPAGLTYHSSAPSRGAFSAVDSLWTVGSLGVGESASLVLRAVVAAGTAGSVLTNSAAVVGVAQVDVNPLNDDAAVPVQVRAADLELSKLLVPTSPSEGDTVLYKIDLVNAGPDTATGVVILDNLPAGMTYVSHSLNRGAYASATGQWTVGALPPAWGARLTIKASVDLGTAGLTIVNTAYVAAADQADPDPSDDVAAAGFGFAAADLQLSKIVDASAPDEGDTLTFVVTLSNAGPSPASGTTVDDALPTGLTLLGAVPSRGSYSAATGAWTVGALDSAEAASLTMTARVDPGTTGNVLVNIAQVVGSDQPDPDGTNNRSECEVRVRGADLTLGKSVEPTRSAEGGSVVFTLTLENAGPDTANEVVVSDPLPVGVSNAYSIASQGAYQTGTGLWFVGSIAPGSVATLDVSGTVDAGTSGSIITNVASIQSADEADPDPTNNEAAATVTVQSADLALAKLVTPATVSEGDTLVYTIALLNNGPDNATGIVVAESLPSGTAFVSATPGRGSYDSGSGQWSIGSVSTGETATLTLRARVLPGTAGSVLTNTASLFASTPTDVEPANNSASATAAVLLVDLRITKAASNPTPDEGDTLTFTVTLTNAGPDSSDGITVRDTLPVGLSFVGSTATRGYFLPATGTWVVGALRSGESATLSLATRVNAGTGGTTLVNTAFVSSARGTDSTPADRTASASVSVRSADLSVHKAVDRTRVREGDSITYTITVANQGPSPAGGVGVTDVLPTGLSLLGQSPSQGSYAGGVWTVGSIPAAGTATLTLGARVETGTHGTTITNRAFISARDQADPQFGNDADSVAVTVYDRSADLSLAKTASNDDPNVGDIVSYVVTLANAGPDTATGVTVSDKLPAGLTYSGGTFTQGSYSPATGLWTVGTVPPGQTGTLTVSAAVNQGTAGATITNTAVVAGVSEADPNPANDTAGAVVTIQAADLTLSKGVSKGTASLGDTLTYTIALGNAGPSGATGVRVVDTLPAGTTLLQATPALGTFAPSGQWDVGTLAPAQSASLVLRVRINPDFTGVVIRNVAAVTAVDQIDPHPGAEADTAETVLPNADLDVGLSLSESAPVVGDPFTCTVVAANKGPNSVGGVQVAIPLPEGAGLTKALASAGAYDPATARWTVGALTVSAEASLTLTLTPAVASAGDTLVFAAEVAAADRDDPDPGNNRASAIAVPAYPLLVTVDAQSGTSLLPGAAPKEVLHMKVINRSAAVATLTALTLTNAAAGSGTPAQRDRDWSALSLTTGSAAISGSSPSASFVSGEATFSGLAVTVPADGERDLVVWGGASLTARDGDLLDLKVTGSSALLFAGGTQAAGTWPLDPAGAFPVDGMTLAQIDAGEVPSGTVLLGEKRRLALDVTIPANGYEADIWRSLALVNLGDADPEGDIRAVEVWRDGGNQRFDAGAGDDVNLGRAKWREDRWVLDGFWRSIPTEGLRIFATVDVDTLGAPERTIRLAIPQNGILVESNNDGPIDGAAAGEGTLVVAASPSEVIIASVEAQSGAALLPGGAPETLYRLHLFNNSETAQTLTGVTFESSSTGPGTAVERSADWSSVTLGRVPGEGAIVPLATASVCTCTIAFTGFSLSIPAETEIILAVTGGASLQARDGDVLDLRIVSAGSFAFANEIPVMASWPLDPYGSFPIDGMAAAQITLHPVEPENLAAGSRRNLLLDAVLPANGYEADELIRFNLVNLGSALPEADISALELWADEGDGAFDATEDLRLGALSFTGDRWEITGLAEPVPLAGLRIFVTADIAELATEGRTVQFRIPGVKDVGVGMSSNNDGPRDRAVTNPESAAITTSNRVTLAASPLAGGLARPGARGVTLLKLAATNTYDSARTISRLSFTNVSERGELTGASMDEVVQLLELRLDANENGVLDAPAVDPVLGSARFLSGRADFDGLEWGLAPGRTQHVFLAASVSLTAASDGDRLGAAIAGLRDVTFHEPVTVAAGWPIDSAGRWTVDGMVAAQIGVLAGAHTTLGPGEGPFPAFDFVVPANGALGDVLLGVQLHNLGSAGPAEVAELHLWSDGGDGLFSASGDDTDLGRMFWTGGAWASPVLHASVPPEGLRLFAAVTVSPTLADDSTVELAVPVNGITVDSGNDGPTDRAVPSGYSILLSAAPILASIETDPEAVTVNQEFAVKMAVRNRDAAPITGVVPSVLSVTGDAQPTLVSGPDRSGLTLAPSAADTITWVYRAVAAGTAAFTGHALGTRTGGSPAFSAQATSNALRAYVGAGALGLYSVGPRTMSVTRGQTGLVPLTLTLLNPGSDDASDIRLRRMRLKLENDEGTPVAAGAVLQRLQVSEGSRVYVSRTRADLIAAGTEIDLVFSPSVLIATTEPTTLNLLLDIAEDATIPGFRIAVLDGTWFTAEDATSGAPVDVAPRETSYPLHSGFVRLGVEATSVHVRGVNAPEVRVGQGQTDVSLLAFTLESPGVDGLTMDARFGGMGLVLVDDAGHAIAAPEQVLDRVSVRSPLKLLGEKRVVADASGVIRLTFTGFLSLPVNTPVTLTVSGDIAAGAEAASCRLRLADPSTVDAWEPTTLESLPAVYETTPIEGVPLRVERPAERLTAVGDPEFPTAITVGSRGTVALRGTLRHPGGTGTAPIRVDSLTVRCWDRERSALPPGTYFERLHIVRSGDEAAAALGPSWDRPVPIAVGGWMLEPGASVEFELVADVDPRAPTALLELVMEGGDILAVDANTLRRVPVEAATGAQLPLYSGLVRLESPPREIQVGLASLMPAALAPDGREVPAATLTFVNPAVAGSGPVRIDHLVVQASDRERRAIAIGAAAERLVVYRDGTAWATSASLSPDSTTAWIAFPEPIAVESSTQTSIEVRPVIRAGTAFTSLRLGWGDSGIGVIQPEGTLLTVAIRPRDGGDFPLWTASGELGPGTLRDSYANFPNPFAAGREHTAFVFYLPDAAQVSLKVWTARGEPVVTVLEGEQRPPGLWQEDFWDGRNGRGDVVQNGVYIAELSVRFENGESERLLRKVAVVR